MMQVLVNDLKKNTLEKKLHENEKRCNNTIIVELMSTTV